MQTRNYQLLTIAGAVLLLLAPLGVAVLVANGGSTPDSRTADSAIAGSATLLGADVPARSVRAPDEIGLLDGSDGSDGSSVTDLPTLPRDAGPGAAVPLPMPSPVLNFPAGEVPISAGEPAASAIPAVMPAGPAEVTPQELQPPQPVVPEESFYDATGHLALTSLPQLLPDPTDSSAKQADAQRPAQGSAAGPGGAASAETPAASGRDAASDSQDRKSRPRRRPSPEDRSRAARDRRDVSQAGSAAGPTGADRVRPADRPDNLVDVIIQTPLESGRVRKIEDVVAVTSAAGWPIALVRSDIPDDEWWVQQMVTIQGTQFAARVNFGNEHSLPGGAYRMVFVFLDSPDEVRRFRIAKRFKELPEGIRRSREFRYVRN